MKAYYEHLPIYERNVFYADCTKAAITELKKYFKESDIELDHIKALTHVKGYAATVTGKGKYEKKTLAYLMVVDKSADVGTVAHEANHVTNYIFDYLGQYLDLDNDEAQSYLLGHLTAQFCDKIQGLKKPSRVLSKTNKTRNLEI